MRARSFPVRHSLNYLRVCATSLDWKGGHFQAVLEDAMSADIESKNQERVRPAVMGHFYASLERNRRLGELLGKS